MVKITNNHEKSVAAGRFFAKLLLALVEGGVLAEAFERAKPELPADWQDSTQKAMTQDWPDNEALIEEFGAACPLRYSLPVGLYIVRTSNSYAEVRIHGSGKLRIRKQNFDLYGNCSQNSFS
jgi:hypothetical protein